MTFTFDFRTALQIVDCLPGLPSTCLLSLAILQGEVTEPRDAVSPYCGTAGTATTGAIDASTLVRGDNVCCAGCACATATNSISTVCGIEWLMAAHQARRPFKSEHAGRSVRSQTAVTNAVSRQTFSGVVTNLPTVTLYHPEEASQASACTPLVGHNALAAAIGGLDGVQVF